MRHLILKSWLLYIILFLGLSRASFAQNDSCSHLTIAFAGDMMCHMPQQKAAYDSNHDTYDFSPCFQFLKPYIQSRDLAIINLETVFAGKPYSGYPQFSCPDVYAKAAQDAGFNYFIMANNHCYDRDHFGFDRTLNTLDSFKIVHTGIFRNKTERQNQYPLIITKNNISVAILNFTYGTNGISVDTPHVVNTINRAQIAADIDSVKKQNPDAIIACVHWGMEYERKQNKQQEDLAKWLFEKGCNAVIGSHPHVVQPIKIVYPDSTDSTNIKVVYYSVGNFLSNQRDRYRDGGIIAELTFEKDTATRLISFNYMPYWVYKGTLHGKYQYYAIPVDSFLKDTTAFPIPDTDKFKLREFHNDTKSLLGKMPENNFYKK